MTKYAVFSHCDRTGVVSKGAPVALQAAVDYAVHCNQVHAHRSGLWSWVDQATVDPRQSALNRETSVIAVPPISERWRQVFIKELEVGESLGCYPLRNADAGMQALRANV